MVAHYSYSDFIQVLDRARYIASDSATIQQEAYYMRKPYLLLADYRIQTEGLGRNAVLCKSDKKIIKDFLKNYKRYQKKPKSYITRPSKIIVDYLLAH